MHFLFNNDLTQASIFHYGSISLIDEPCKSTHLAAMTIAKKSGSILSYDVNLRLPLWPSEDAAREGIMSIWDQADVIKVNCQFRGHKSKGTFLNCYFLTYIFYKMSLFHGF